MKKETIKRCNICGKSFNGHGHCSEPIKKGKCCDYCNIKIVIPRRNLMRLINAIKKEE